jgi:single-strand DNA-binding protein
MSSNFNFNQAIIAGRITADPELKQTPQGVNVCSFSVAVKRKFSGKQEEQQSDFINCIAWRSTAEFIRKYFSKGAAICCRGAIQTRSWTDNNGTKRYATEVVVNEAMFVDSKGATNEGEEPKHVAESPTFTEQQATFEDVTDDEDLPF